MSIQHRTICKQRLTVKVLLLVDDDHLQHVEDFVVSGRLHWGNASSDVPVHIVPVSVLSEGTFLKPNMTVS